MGAQIFSFRRQHNCITEHNGNDRGRSHLMAQTPPVTNGCGWLFYFPTRRVLFAFLAFLTAVLRSIRGLKTWTHAAS